MRACVLWPEILLLAPVVGCTGAVSNAATAGDAEAMTTNAVVIVERSVDVAAGTRAETSARFVRLPAGASTRDALRSIGAATVALPASATCASIASLTNGATTAQAAPVVELADVGGVSLEANGHETHLIPRQLPDVTDVVNGVVYARAADPALLPAGTRYLVHVAGGADVDPFEAPASAPADPGDVHVIGEDAPGGLLVAAGAPIELTWTADGTDDVLYLDVQPAAFRCALPNGPEASGAHATVPASLVDEAGTLIVHRLHREALVARGIDSGEVRFDFSRTVAYVRR